MPCLDKLTVGYNPALLSQFYALGFGVFLGDINEPKDSVPVAVHSDGADHGPRLRGVTLILFRQRKSAPEEALVRVLLNVISRRWRK